MEMNLKSIGKIIPFSIMDYGARAGIRTRVAGMKTRNDGPLHHASRLTLAQR